MSIRYILKLTFHLDTVFSKWLFIYAFVLYLVINPPPSSSIPFPLPTLSVSVPLSSVFSLCRAHSKHSINSSCNYYHELSHSNLFHPMTSINSYILYIIMTEVQNFCHELQTYRMTYWDFLPGCATGTSTQHVQCLTPLSFSSKLPLLLIVPPTSTLTNSSSSINSRKVWNLQSFQAVSCSTLPAPTLPLGYVHPLYYL